MPKHAELLSRSLRLVDTVTTAERGDTRSCSGTIKAGEDPGAIEVPIEYEVFETDDGQIKYRWNDTWFGKQFIATGMMQAVTDALSGTTNGDRRPPTVRKPDLSGAFRQHGKGSLGTNTIARLKPAVSETDKWKSSVRALILERARIQTGMPHGTQTLSFRVGPAGEVTTVSAVGAIQNPEMAKAAVKFLTEMDRVPSPPESDVFWFSMTVTW